MMPGIRAVDLVPRPCRQLVEELLEAIEVRRVESGTAQCVELERRVLRRSGLRLVSMAPAPSPRARPAVSNPIPELPPITTTVCPRSCGSRKFGETVFGVVMVYSRGDCFFVPGPELNCRR